MNEMDNNEEIISNSAGTSNPKPLRKLKRIQPSKAAPSINEQSNVYHGAHEASPHDMN